MTDLTLSTGDRLTVDRDYMGDIGEDVQFRIWGDDDVSLFLSPDEADQLADALTHHAAEVRQINKEPS